MGAEGRDCIINSLAMRVILLVLFVLLWTEFLCSNFVPKFSDSKNKNDMSGVQKFR